MPGRSDGVSERPDAHGEGERLHHAVSPRFQVRVTEPIEPGIVGGKSAFLLEETEGHDQRPERVGDGRVAPVQYAQVTVVLEEVVHVEVIVLNRFWDGVRCEFAAQLCESTGESAQPSDLVTLERQLVAHEVLVAFWHRRDPKIRNVVCQMLLSVDHLATL